MLLGVVGEAGRVDEAAAGLVDVVEMLLGKSR